MVTYLMVELMDEFEKDRTKSSILKNFHQSKKVSLRVSAPLYVYV